LSRDLAEDLAQEVLLLLHEKYAHLESVEDLLPLSLQIVRFKIISQRRKSARRGEYTQVSITDIQLPDLDANPAEYVERKQMLERLAKAMSGLGDRCRELMRLKLQGKAFPEIQKIMGAAAMNTIYTWDHRCRKKLLGGYATGTLTTEEQQALFAAALEDQELFDALAREQSLRDLLRDPAARAHLLAALDEPAPAPWFRRWWMPLPAAAVAVVLATVAITANVAVRRHPASAPEVTVAKLEPPEASPVAALAPPTPAEPRLPRARANAVMAKAKKSPPVTVARGAPPPAPPPPWPRLDLQAPPPVTLPPSTKGTAAPKMGAATDGPEMVLSYATSAGLEKARAETIA